MVEYIANELYHDLCEDTPGNCCHGKKELFHEIIKDVTQWVFYFEVFEKRIKHCICKCSIKNVYKIVNKVNGDIAYVGSSCVNKIYSKDPINFKFNDIVTPAKQMLFKDTTSYNEYQDAIIQQLLKLTKKLFNTNIVSCEKNYLIYRPYILYKTTPKENRVTKEEMMRKIEINKYLHSNKTNIENIEYIRDNTGIVSNAIWCNGRNYKRKVCLLIPIQSAKRILDELYDYPELMHDFKHTCKSGVTYKFKDILKWKNTKSISDYNKFFELYHNIV